jgi:murein DD-endopeptidase MepM/ murein hydrolase activator NlpD
LALSPEPKSVHVVAAGESLWKIAKARGVAVAALREANPEANPQALRVGMSLRVPPASTPLPAVQTANPRYALTWPVQGEVTSRFGQRWGRDHEGIDIGAPRGTDVRAAAAGNVVLSQAHGTYGNLVVLRHGDGLFTVYAHNDINLVREGQAVSGGDVIAKVGQSGRASGPHLHFEVRQGKAAQNPMRFLPP